MMLSWLGQQAQRETSSSPRARRGRRRPAARQPHLEVLEDRLVPATITVMNTADSGPGSLRQAIQDANTMPGDDTIIFNPGVTGVIDLNSALPDLSSNINLQGPGASTLTVERSAAGTPDFRIFNVTFGTTVSLTGLTIANGNTVGAGAGVNNDGTLTISNCTIRDNSADGPVTGGFISLGGGISNDSSLTISNSTISGNRAVNGAGISGGGGIRNAGTMIVTNCTISGNSGGTGGGVLNTLGATATVTYATITLNSDGFDNVGTATVTDSLIAGNPNSAGRDFDFSGAMISGGHNLIGNGDGGSGFSATDLVGSTSQPINPRLGPLQDNGGPTFTHALRLHSPALDQGGPVAGVTTDQRGLPRPVDLPTIPNAPGGDGSDIGAFEAQTLPPNDPPPLAANDTALSRQIPVVIPVLANDRDPDGDRLTVTSVSQPAHGTARINADGTITYSPEANFLGNDSFTYSISDGLGGTASATVTVTVSPGFTPNQLFVMQAFQDVLGRAVESVNIFSTLLDLGLVNRFQVALAIETSLEARVHQVQILYATYLHRAPDPSGLGALVSFLGTGGTLEQAAAFLIGSPEYYQLRAGSTSDGFLNAVYQDVLRRDVDPSGRATFDFALHSGGTGAQVALTILLSKEYQQDFVQASYQQLLHRPADPATLVDFMLDLNLGARDEEVQMLLLGLEEYTARLI